MKKILVILLIFTYAVCSVKSQNYVTLINATNLELTSEQFDSLNYAAQKAIENLPSADQPLFKFYEAGLYVHSPSTAGGIPHVWIQAIDDVENDPASDYYLLLGRESNSEKVHYRIRAKLKLPYSSEYNCLSEEERNNLEKYIEQVANDNLHLGYAHAEIAALELLRDYFYKIVTCDCLNLAVGCDLFIGFNYFLEIFRS